MMDKHADKRGVGRTSISTDRLRGSSSRLAQNAEFCTRLGCSGRLKQTKINQVELSKKAKHPSPMNTPKGKGIAENSGSSLLFTTAKSPRQGSWKVDLSQPDNDPSETIQNTTQKGSHSKFSETVSAEDAVIQAGMSIGPSVPRSQKIVHSRSVSANQNRNSGSSVSSASNNLGERVINKGNVGASGLKKLKCNTISDAIPRSCSTSVPKLARRDVMKKSSPDGGNSSSSRGNHISGTLFKNSRVSSSCISNSDSRQGRNTTMASTRTQRSINVSARTNFADMGSASSSRHALIPQSDRPESSATASVCSSSDQFDSGASSSGSSSYGLTRNSDNAGLSSSIPVNATEFGNTVLSNSESIRRNSMDGIAEVLLALQRIEQDEEITYQQLLALETNLLLGGLYFYDQHRDMRLDIDNMSYEDLLALEERMGNVSTALSEKELQKCIRRCMYLGTPNEQSILGCRSEDGIKCCICQEEYEAWDDLGRLGCKHEYHVECIEQWLRLKNWCPICKVSAMQSQKR